MDGRPCMNPREKDWPTSPEGQMAPKVLAKVVYFVRHGESQANVDYVYRAGESELTSEALSKLSS